MGANVCYLWIHGGNAGAPAVRGGQTFVLFLIHVIDSWRKCRSTLRAAMRGRTPRSTWTRSDAAATGVSLQAALRIRRTIRPIPRGLKPTPNRTPNTTIGQPTHRDHP
jgi:hypothetical protein